jgi:hypothetical protein
VRVIHDLDYVLKQPLDVLKHNLQMATPLRVAVGEGRCPWTWMMYLWDQVHTPCLLPPRPVMLTVSLSGYLPSKTILCPHGGWQACVHQACSHCSRAGTQADNIVSTVGPSNTIRMTLHPPWALCKLSYPSFSTTGISYATSTQATPA